MNTPVAEASEEATMNLQKELRHKSEDIDNQVLLDVVKALRRRVRSVNRDYDVPYIAGYSVDGKTIFIDRHLPRTFRWLLTTGRGNPSTVRKNSSGGDSPHGTASPAGRAV